MKGSFARTVQLAAPFPSTATVRDLAPLLGDCGTSLEGKQACARSLLSRQQNAHPAPRGDGNSTAPEELPEVEPNVHPLHFTLDRCTLIVGLDAQHLEELRWTWPTWLRFKPELLEMPMIAFYDPLQLAPRDATFLEVHPRLRWIPWEFPPARDQREKMITGFVHIPAREVSTPWYLKLDTDTIATGTEPWIMAEWFEPDGRGRVPVIVSARWNYSKPGDVIKRLDAWGDRVRHLARFPRLNLEPSTMRDRVYHRRIISWIFFGRTDWTRTVGKWPGGDGRLPCPSQDTYLFYCAKRGRRRIVRERMFSYGWRHTNLRAIRRMVTELGLSRAD